MVYAFSQVFFDFQLSAEFAFAEELMALDLLLAVGRC